MVASNMIWIGLLLALPDVSQPLLLIKREQAQRFLSTFTGSVQEIRSRVRRANSKLFEEWSGGNYQRECLDEACSFEELRETKHYDNEDDLRHGWNLLVDRCRNAPKKCNPQGTKLCINRWNDMECRCKDGFMGKLCYDKVFKPEEIVATTKRPPIIISTKVQTTEAVKSIEPMTEDYEEEEVEYEIELDYQPDDFASNRRFEDNYADLFYQEEQLDLPPDFIETPNQNRNTTRVDELELTTQSKTKILIDPTKLPETETETKATTLQTEPVTMTEEVEFSQKSCYFTEWGKWFTVCDYQTECMDTDCNVPADIRIILNRRHRECICNNQVMDDAYLCQNEENFESSSASHHLKQLTDIQIKTKEDDQHKLKYITCDSDEFRKENDRIHEKIELIREKLDKVGGVIVPPELTEFDDDRFVDHQVEDESYDDFLAGLF